MFYAEQVLKQAVAAASQQLLSPAAAAPQQLFFPADRLDLMMPPVSHGFTESAATMQMVVGAGAGAATADIPYHMLGNRGDQLSLEECRALGSQREIRWDEATEAGPSMAAFDTNKDDVISQVDFGGYKATEKLPVFDV